MKKTQERRYVVLLTKEVHDRIKSYADKHGLFLNRLAEKAILDFLIKKEQDEA
jgi:hypothetical protein